MDAAQRANAPLLGSDDVEMSTPPRLGCIPQATLRHVAGLYVMVDTLTSTINTADGFAC